MKDKKWTIEEGIEETNAMEQGKGDFVVDDYDYNKPGDIRKCYECKTPIDIVTYGGYDMDVMSVPNCDKCDTERPNLKLEECTSKDCPVHTGPNAFDEEKYDTESKAIDKVIHTIRDAIVKIKPRNDSIMEYDRVKTIIEHGCYSRGIPDSFELWFFEEFVNYLGLRGMLKVK